MAKFIKLTPEQEQDTQRIIDNMTPEQLEQMHAFEQEFEQMPEEMRDMMFDLVQQLAEMPEGERNQVLEDMDRFAELMDGYMEDFDDDESDEDLDSEYNYPHFLPRENVQKYTLRVTLQGSDPKIYRKFNVPSNITLRHLSELILELMGWTNEHLNQFRKGNDYYAPAYQREHELPPLFATVPDGFPSGPRNHNQEEYTLSDILNVKGKTVEWEYDFGDSWCHDVRLSSIGEYAEGEPLITFIKGERECPPEDCGGIWGYTDLLELHEKKKSRKRLTADEKDRLEWYEMDEDFDPADFDTDFAQEICQDFCE